MRILIGMLLFASPVAAGEPEYTWRSHPTDSDRVYLYRDGTQVGGWCYSAKHYRTFDGTTWGPPIASAPTRPPAQIVVQPPAVPRPLVVSPSSTSVPRLRGPLRNRAATIMADTITEGTVRIMEEIPGAILKSILSGNAKWSIEVSPPKRP